MRPFRRRSWPGAAAAARRALVVGAQAMVACAPGDARDPAGDGGVARPAAATRPALPDAERRSLPGLVAFVAEAGGRRATWVATPDGRCALPLTRDAADAYPAGFSPAGDALLVVRAGRAPGAAAARDGRDVEWLELHPLDGGAPRVIGRPSTRVRNPSWSPDGRWIVYESDHEAFRELYRVRVAGGPARRLTRHEAGNYEPAVSPDARRIAFTSSRDGQQQLYVMDADGRGARRLTAFHRDDWEPRWSADGHTLAFLSRRDGEDRVFLVEGDGTGLRPLGAAGSPVGAAWREEGHAWAPVAPRLAVTRRAPGAAPQVDVVDAHTGARRTVARGASEPAWSPDARHMAWVAGSGDGARLMVARADGSAVSALAPAVSGAQWLPRWGATAAAAHAVVVARCGAGGR